MTNVSEPSKFWSAVGRGAGLLTAVALVFQIGAYIVGNSQADLAVSGDASAFSLPPTLARQMNTFPDSLFTRLVRRQCDSTTCRIPPLSPFAIDSLFRGYRFPEITGPNRVNTQWTFIITNHGDREAKEIRFESEEDGYYELRERAQPARYGEFSEVIPIGSLRPNNQATLTVWTGSYSVKDKFQFTYADGVVKPRFPERVTGVLAWIARSLWLAPMLIGVVSMLILGVLALLTDNGRTRVKPHTIQAEGKPQNRGKAR